MCLVKIATCYDTDKWIALNNKTQYSMHKLHKNIN